MKILETHIVPASVQNVRFIDYVVSVIQTLNSRSSMKKAIKKGDLLLDGKLVSGGTWLKGGEKIDLLETNRIPPKVLNMKLEILFEDEYLAIINKPAGISVSGNKYKTIQNALPANLNDTSMPDALRWPRPVHRLDFSTSGLLLIAKTSSAIIHLGQQFEERKIKKIYRAIVTGKPEEKGEIKEDINGKEAFTSYKVLTRVPSLYTDWVTLVEIYPKTGRTHQIRKHMAHIGHPVLGDSKYGFDLKLLRGKGLFLTSTGISFRHPISGKPVSYSIEMPAKFNKRLETEQRRWEKYHVL